MKRTLLCLHQSITIDFVALLKLHFIIYSSYDVAKSSFCAHFTNHINGCIKLKPNVKDCSSG